MMMPFQILLLQFVTIPEVVGTVVEEAVSQSITIVMSPSTQQTTSVSFDLDNGWNFGSNTNCVINQPNTELVPILYPPAPGE